MALVTKNKGTHDGNAKTISNEKESVAKKVNESRMEKGVTMINLSDLYSKEDLYEIDNHLVFLSRKFSKLKF